jgi:hypothetical protein
MNISAILYAIIKPGILNGKNDDAYQDSIIYYIIRTCWVLSIIFTDVFFRCRLIISFESSIYRLSKTQIYIHLGLFLIDVITATAFNFASQLNVRVIALLILFTCYIFSSVLITFQFNRRLYRVIKRGLGESQIMRIRKSSTIGQEQERQREQQRQKKINTINSLGILDMHKSKSESSESETETEAETEAGVEVEVENEANSDTIPHSQPPIPMPINAIKAKAP